MKKQRRRKTSVEDWVRKLTSIVKFKVPSKCKCLECFSKVVRISMLFAGPWSGNLKCTKCNWTMGTMQYIGNKILDVQPFPEKE